MNKLASRAIATAVMAAGVGLAGLGGVTSAQAQRTHHRATATADRLTPADPAVRDREAPVPPAVRGPAARVGLAVQVAQGTRATPAADMADMALGDMSLAERAAPVVRDPGDQASQVGTNRVALASRGRVVQGLKVRDRRGRVVQFLNPDRALRDRMPTVPERADLGPTRVDPRLTHPDRRREQTAPEARMRLVEAIPRVEVGPRAAATHRRSRPSCAEARTHLGGLATVSARAVSAS